MDDVAFIEIPKTLAWKAREAAEEEGLPPRGLAEKAIRRYLKAREGEEKKKAAKGGKGALASQTTESQTTEGQKSRRGLSIEEIVDEVERELAEKGPPLEEKLLGVKVSRLPEAVLEGLPYEAFEDVREAFGLTARELAGLLGSSLRAIRRRREKGRLDPAESDGLYRMARLYALAAEVLGSEESGRGWLQAPHALLGGAPPLELARTSASTEVVESILYSIEHGFVR